VCLRVEDKVREGEDAVVAEEEEEVFQSLGEEEAGHRVVLLRRASSHIPEPSVRAFGLAVTLNGLLEKERKFIKNKNKPKSDSVYYQKDVPAPLPVLWFPSETVQDEKTLDGFLKRDEWDEHKQKKRKEKKMTTNEVRPGRK